MKEVMSMAWRFFKVTGESFADCLKRSWLVYKLTKAMKTKTVQFFYQKVNGEIRQAFGTMKDEIIHDKVKVQVYERMKIYLITGIQRQTDGVHLKSLTL